MLRLYKIFLLSILVTAIYSVRAYACGFCMFALFDSFLPPIYFWCTLAFIWYIAVSLVGIKYGIKLANLLTGAAVSIAVFAGLAGALLMFGPVTLLPLALPALMATFLAIVNVGTFKQKKSARIAVIIIGFTIMFLVGLGLLWRKNILATRTDAKVYMQWSDTMTGRGLMAKFKQNEPASIIEYRYIIDNGKGSAVADAARRLGIIGDPKIDIPRLKLALTKVDKSYNIKEVQDAIDSLIVKESNNLNIQKKSEPIKTKQR